MLIELKTANFYRNFMQTFPNRLIYKSKRFSRCRKIFNFRYIQQQNVIIANILMELSILQNKIINTNRSTFSESTKKAVITSGNLLMRFVPLQYFCK